MATFDPDGNMSRAVRTAYTAIRNDIITGKLNAGDVLPESDLAESIGVSRTPIREALSRLRSEGLIVLEKYRKSYVADFSEEDITELLTVRALLEGYAAGRAATRLTEDELGRIRELTEQMETIVEEGADTLANDFAVLNQEFHRMIYSAANVPRLKWLLETSLEVPFKPTASNDIKVLQKKLQLSCHYHNAILVALEARDPERARKQLEAHILSIIPYRT